MRRIVSSARLDRAATSAGARSKRGSRYARYGLLFAAAGLATLRLAARGGVVGWLLVWLSICCFVVAAGYTSFGARVLGKRNDGALPLVHRAMLLPYFAFTWGAWHLSRLSRERSYDLVSPGLYLGRLPRHGELPSDVVILVDLTAEFEVDRRLRTEREYVCLPTLDGTAPDETRCLALVERLRAHPGPIYIHCAYGHGRSAVVAAAVLLARGDAANIAEAVAKLKSARPGVALTAPQRALLERMVAVLVPRDA